MNWNQLRYVIQIAEEGNLSRAAEKLYISQPSLSVSLRSLEEELGTPLFVRSGSGVSLTLAGKEYVEWARHTLKTHNRLRKHLQGRKEAAPELLRLGISPYRSSILIPPVVEKFCSCCPNTTLCLEERPTSDLKQALEREELDLLIDIPHEDSVNFCSEVLVEEKLLIAVPEVFVGQLDAGLRDGESIPLGALRDFPFLLQTEEQVIGKISRRMLSAASVLPDVRMICVSAETILGLVRHGMGIAFVPELLRKSYPEGIRYYEETDHPGRRQVCMVYARNKEASVPLKALMEIFREEVPLVYEKRRSPE